MEDLKQAEKEMMAESDDNHSWVGGAVLIAVGIIFLFSNFTNFSIDNWWALFILVPVVAAWSEAFKSMRHNGRLTQDSVNQLTGSLFPLFVACIFLFNWNWGQVWPGFIILAGVAALFNNRWR